MQITGAKIMAAVLSLLQTVFFLEAEVSLNFRAHRTFLKSEMENQESDFLLQRVKPKAGVRRHYWFRGIPIIAGLIGLIALLWFLRSKPATPLVSTKLGKIRGVTMKSREGRDFHGFYNLPYAQPPVGLLRFEAPLPAQPWEGIRDCTVVGPDCTQVPKGKTLPEGSEDCLYVNVFTPQLTPEDRNLSRLPVLFFVFGGDRMFGSANDYHPDYFMDEEVIIVFVQYRLSVFGWLSTGDSVLTGNQALKDVVLALSWVQENIQSFGGDPKRVTLWGQCSGAIKAHNIILSPTINAKGYFSRAIIMSGTALQINGFQTDPRGNAIALGKSLNCSSEDSAALLKCFRAADAMDLAVYSNNPPNFWAPSLEKMAENANSSSVFFSASPPASLIESKIGSHVPAIFGDVSNEAVRWACPLVVNNRAGINADWEPFIRNQSLMYLNPPTPKLSRSIFQKIQEFYLGKKKIAFDNWQNFTNVLSDRIENHPSKTAAVYNAQHSPTYLYTWSKQGPTNISVIRGDGCENHLRPPYGVLHQDELQFLMPNQKYPYIPLNSKYAYFSKAVVKLFTAFASGDPMDLFGAPWLPISENDNGKYRFNIDDKPGIIEPFTSRMDLWDSFPFNVIYNQTMKSNLHLKSPR